jgi:hypothetical protein
MNKNNATQIATAFTTYDSLSNACRGGYIPTLTVGKSDDLPTRRAKTILLGALTADGHQVHE